MKIVAKSDGRDLLLLQASDTMSVVANKLCHISKVTDVAVDDVLKNCELSGASMWEVSQIVETVRNSSSRKTLRGCCYEKNRRTHS